jgi:hypothetical protein
MKRLISFIIPVLFLTQLNAQDAVDALRYSQTYPGGTARSLSMGGAFGSLGADIYSAIQNPAGLGMYRGSELTITPELQYISVNSRYYGNKVSDSKYNFNLSNLGYVRSFQNNESGFIGATIALGFNRINNFHSNIRTSGINYYNSMAHSITESANNNGNPVGIDDLLPFDEWLFYDGELIYDQADGFYATEPDIDYSLDSTGSGIRQIQSTESRGRMNEWFFSAGFNYNHVLYFGGTFSLIIAVYKEDIGYNEFDGEDSQYEFYYFNNTMDTKGLGVTGKFGVLVRPLHFFRIGLAYHLPVSYSFTMEYNAFLESRYTNPQWITIRPQDSNGNYIDYGESKFRLVTPGKAIGSVSFTIGDFATVAADVEYMDYTKTRLKGTYVTFPENANDVIKNIYKGAWNLKTGAEIRFGKLYLRGGFDYLQSPYAKGEINEKADQYIITSGLGLREKNFFIDFAYAYHFYDERAILYAYQTRFNTMNYDVARSRFMMTFGVRF